MSFAEHLGNNLDRKQTPNAQRNQLQNEVWFHGFVSRQEAEALLTKVSVNKRTHVQRTFNFLLQHRTFPGRRVSREGIARLGRSVRPNRNAGRNKETLTTNRSGGKCSYMTFNG